MISNLPCLNCFKMCTAKFCSSEDNGPAEQTPSKPVSSFLEKIKANMPPPPPVPKKPRERRAPTLSQVTNEIAKRRCTTNACGLVPARAAAWREEERNIVSEALNGMYTFHGDLQGTFATFVYAVPDRSAISPALGQLNDVRQVYISKTADHKSRYMMKLYIFLAPITCPNCSSEHIPIKEYVARGRNHECSICPFCGYQMDDWNAIFKLKDWSYVNRTPDDIRSLIKWSWNQTERR